MRRATSQHLMVWAIFLTAGLTACAGATDTPPTATESAPPTDTIESSPPIPMPPNDATIQKVAGQITWLRSTNSYGHTGVKLEFEGQVLYLDPVDPVGLENLPKADWILITHDHADHLSIKTINALSKPDTAVVSIRNVQYSLTGVRFFSLAPGGTVEAGGLQMQGVAAYNNNHPKELGYLGFLFAIQGVRIYCSGDTGLTPEMEALRGIDIALLNIRKPYSLSGKDAVAFAGTVKPKILIPLHWMPEGDTYGDAAEIEYLRQNTPAGTELKILSLWPEAP